ncbi:unnamed protein product [marine sediment metagenome]|uniref:Uncharacterized protein n=1 Tax=marine sediment metagenome TaxID=412755 RepID=X1L7G2_9ZZZZ
MVTRIFREKVYTVMTAGATKDVHDITGVMQDIAPRKGFKLYAARFVVNVGDAAAVDHSETYLNILKNISEAAHHTDPSADGEYTENDVDGVIMSQMSVFHENDDTRQYQYEFYGKPIVYDANDRMNLELTFDNKDALSAKAIFRLFLDVEIA